MNDDRTPEARLVRLERHVVEQDKAMLEVSREIDRLKRQLAALRERQNAGAAPGGPAEADERPPHY